MNDLDFETLIKIKPFLKGVNKLDREKIEFIARDAGFSRGSGINSEWYGPANTNDRTHDALYRFAAMIQSQAEVSNK